MNLSERERRLLTAMIPALLIIFVIGYWPESSEVAPPQDTGAAIEAIQQRLAKARATAALIPARANSKKQLEAELATIEKRLVIADTPAQAQSQLLQIFRRVARAQGSSIDMRSSDLGLVRPSGEYAEISMNVSFDSQIEGLVNLLADLASQPELVSWRDLRVVSPDSKQKRITVNMTLVAMAPKKLVPAPPKNAGGY
jgi:hypothetical protein